MRLTGLLQAQTKYAVVWGSSVKHSRGQKCGGSHVLEDEDVVQIGELAFKRTAAQTNMANAQ
jgi:ribosome-interacting GTPase 1